MGVIYTITNQISGKVYVGQTKRKVEKRWWEHCNSKKEYCSYISNSLKYYGVDKFKFNVIHVCRNYELNDFEKFYIKEYNCMKPNGYNLTEGGENCKPTMESIKKMSNAKKGVKLGPLSEEHKNKIAQANRGKKRTDESKKKMSLAKKGISSGRVLSEESKQKIRIANTGNTLSKDSIKKMIETKLGKENASNFYKTLEIHASTLKEYPFEKNAKKGCNKSISHFLTDGTIVHYESIKKAAETLGVHPTKISAVCRGVRKHIKGMVFRFNFS